MPANYDGGRRQARTADAIRATLDGEAKGREVGPCENCYHRERCRTGLACTRLQPFVNTVRFRAAAPRQPSRDLFEKLFA